MAGELNATPCSAKGRVSDRFGVNIEHAGQLGVGNQSAFPQEANTTNLIRGKFGRAVSIAVADTIF